VEAVLRDVYTGIIRQPQLDLLKSWGLIDNHLQADSESEDLLCDFQDMFKPNNDEKKDIQVGVDRLHQDDNDMEGLDDIKSDNDQDDDDNYVKPEVEDYVEVVNKKSVKKKACGLQAKPSNVSCQESGCTKKFISQQTYLLHLKKTHGRNDLENETIIENRKVMILPNRNFKCPECPKDYMDRSSLAYHIRNSHENNKGTCHLCGKELGKRSLASHMARVHAEKMLHCDQCDYTTPSAVSLKIHIETKHDARRHICHECGKDFAHKIVLTNHIKDKHTDKVYMCDQCDFTCVGQSGQMVVHKQFKHCPVQYICAFCDFVTSSNEELKEHKDNNHQQDKEALLLSPKKINEAKRKEREALKCYICHICQREFKVRQSLSLHIKGDHEGIRFNCPREGCNFSAKQKGGLNIHINAKHLGIKQKCNMCDYQTTQTSNLRIHMVNKHDVHPFSCDKCSFRCQKIEKMKNHMLLMH
jgi:KRAB domain-containing zinc finger protein